VYRNKILLKVPLDLLQIEPIREPTPSVRLERSSKDDEETQEKLTHKLEQSKQQSENEKASPNKYSKKDTGENTEETVEQASTKKQTEVGSTSTQSRKVPVIELDKEWYKFNKKLQIPKNVAWPILDCGTNWPINVSIARLIRKERFYAYQWVDSEEIIFIEDNLFYPLYTIAFTFPRKIKVK